MGGLTRADTRRHTACWLALVLGTSLTLLIGLTSAGSAGAAPAGLHRVGTPAWWRGGTCDPENAPGSHPLGASWDGLVACGPGPTQGGTDHLVDFFPGAWGEFEWECVELSMRWMYLAWGVNPYAADGWDVVSNYDAYKASDNPNGPDLVVVQNGTRGAVPQPGDVVSVGRSQAEPFGHTAVVTANAVDPEGDGIITLIQENGGAGNDGWVTYPVNNWTVGDDVTGWLHNPSWSFQRPLVGFIRSANFEARVSAPGNSFSVLASGTSAIAVAGAAGAQGANGRAFYGYLSRNGNFLVRQASSPTWVLAAARATSIALATTAAGAPVLGFLSPSGNFYAEVGSLTGRFTLEAKGVASIALADNGSAPAPLLGYVARKSRAFLVKHGVKGDTWTTVQRSGVRSIALAEGTTEARGALGFVSVGGGFFAKSGSLAGRWTKEANGVSAISLAAVGPNGTPLLGYLTKSAFYVVEGTSAPAWTKEATGVTAIAVAAGAVPAASPILGYLTASGDVEVRQGPIAGQFSLQARDVTSIAISSVTNS